MNGLAATHWRSWWIKGGLLSLVVYTVIYFLAGGSYQLAHLRGAGNREVVEGQPYLIDTPACRIPNLLANNKEVMQYMSDPDPIYCGKPPLVESNDTHLQIVHSVFPDYGITDPSTASCCYRPMWRNVPNIKLNPKDMNPPWLYDNFSYDNDIRYSKNCYPFHDSVAIHHHLVRVECGRAYGTDLTEIYKDFHVFFPKPQEQKNTKKKGPRLSVLILGIDSLSRLNMIRKLPSTFVYIMKTLKGIPMYGYNKIGLNTFPNLVPLLSGQTFDELVSSCWHNYSSHFDYCPWIWNDFAAKGYRTAFIENSHQIGLFTYYRTGFAIQPTDYDATTLFTSGEKYLQRDSKWYCMGNRKQSDILLKYTSKQLRAMKRYNENFFTFSWEVSSGHDNMNQPGSADPLYYNLLQNIYQEGILNDTFLIFMSDHGLRIGGYFVTPQGRLEEKLPALFIVPPEWFRRKYPVAFQNLVHNQYRLMTTLDMHHTLRDLLDLRSLESESIQNRKIDPKKPISLFSPIPAHRSCSDAGIPDEFCACEHLKSIDVNVPQVIKVAQFVVDEINYNILGENDKCVPRTLKSVKGAARGPPLVKVKSDDSSIVEYEMALCTEPAGALFAAVVRHFTINDTMQLVGQVSRLNAYGSQSACVKEYRLLPFCYCKDN